MRIQSISLIAVFLCASVLINSCTKKDKQSPTITVIDGDQIIQLRTSYNEPGVMAHDSEDGNVTSSIATSGNVDVNTVGSYQIEYTATDKAGNKGRAIRNILVRHTGYSIAGNYHVKDSCGSSESQMQVFFDYATGSGVTRVLLTNFANNPNTFVYFDISGTTGSLITLPNQSVNGNPSLPGHVFSGSGEISADGKHMLIKYTDATNGKTKTCTLIFTRL